MNPRAAGFAVFAFMSAVFVLGCGGSEHEDQMEEQIDALEEAVTVLKSVKDESSARAAKDDLEAVGKRIQELEKKSGEMKAPTEEEGKALLEKYGKELEKVQRELSAEIMRLMGNPALAAILAEPLGKIQGG